MTYLEMEENRHTKNDYYLAQIAAEIRRPNSKKPSSIKVADFLLKLQSKATPTNLAKGTLATNLEGSKHIWAAHLGVDIKKKAT